MQDKEISSLARVASDYGLKWFIRNSKFYVMKTNLPGLFIEKHKPHPVANLRQLYEVIGL